MLAPDFTPNRIEAAKKVAIEFVDGRKGDRIGLVVFAGEAYTPCPATTDHAILKKQIEAANCDVNIEQGTAIGVGLGTAVTRLRNDSLPSKVIILLTDGSNNTGTISPDEAADLAQAKNVRVYTIGIGSTGDGPMAVQTPFGTILQNGEDEIDEATLTRISQKTDGQYFRATDEKSLRAIYTEIEKLEKRKIVDRHYQTEPPAMPMAFLNWAFVFLIASWAFHYGLFKVNE
jgi:Ca-activated chloride channel family protein